MTRQEKRREEKRKEKVKEKINQEKMKRDRDERKMIFVLKMFQDPKSAR